MKQSTARLGRIGEKMAARHLESSGMEVLDRNWRCQVDDLRGEIDLIVRDGDAVVFCEVKTRRVATSAGPLESITPVKLARLRRLAGAWLAEHARAEFGVSQSPSPTARVRIDAVGVHWPEGGGRAVITHLRGIDA